jgi:hypothetical protein
MDGFRLKDYEGYTDTDSDLMRGILEEKFSARKKIRKIFRKDIRKK